jgi:hypothetical protein
MNAPILPEAEAEIQAAAQWYQDRQAGLGEQFLEELVDALIYIENHPRRSPFHPHLNTRRELRRRALSRFPFHVIYEVKDDGLLIIAVAHAHRKPDYWKDRL